MKTLDEKRVELKMALRDLRKAEMDANKKEWEYEKHPEDRRAELAFDRAYKKEFSLYEKCARLLKEFTNGQIDRATARMMLHTQRNKIESMI